METIYNDLVNLSNKNNKSVDNVCDVLKYAKKHLGNDKYVYYNRSKYISPNKALTIIKSDYYLKSINIHAINKNDKVILILDVTDYNLMV